MTMQSGRVSKRLVIIIASLIVVMGLGAAGYFGYRWYQGQQKAAADTKKATADLHITGDQDLATQYITALKANDTTKARKLFADRVAKETDVNKKLDLFTQEVQLALSSKKPDESLYAAEQAIAVRADDHTYAQAAAVCVAKYDTAQQITYLEKAIAYLSATNRADKAQTLQHYQMQLASAQKIQAGLGKKAG